MSNVEPMRWLRESGPFLLAGLALLCLTIGGASYLSDAVVLAQHAWSVGAAAVLVVLLFDMVRAHSDPAAAPGLHSRESALPRDGQS